MKDSYGYRCEYCDGKVRERTVEREVFKHKNAFVILENASIGICDRCGNRYYTAALLRRVQEVASGKMPPDRMEPVPVSHAHK